MGRQVGQKTLEKIGRHMWMAPKGHSNITSDLLRGRVLKKLGIINKVSIKEQGRIRLG